MNKLKCFLLITFFVLLTSGCQANVIDTTAIEVIDIIPNAFIIEKPILSHSESSLDSADALITFINNGLEHQTKVEHSINNDLNVVIQISNSEKRVFSIDLDFENTVGYLTEEEITYKIDEPTFTNFVSSEYFTNNFGNFELKRPKLNLIYKDNHLPFIAYGTLNHQYFNGSVKTDIIKNESKNLAKLPIHYFNPKSTLINIDFSIKPSKIVENIYINNMRIDSYQITDGKIILPQREGHYTIELLCNFDHNLTSTFEGQMSYQFPIYSDIPATFNIVSNEILPGDLLSVKAENLNGNQKVIIDAPFYQKDIHFFPYDDYYMAMIPIDGAIIPGDTSFSLITKEKTVTEDVHYDYDLSINTKEFPTQHLRVTEDTLSIINKENVLSDREKIANATGMDNSANTPLWKDSFIKPVKEATLTTDYYAIRYTNDNPVPRRHKGIDLAAPLGTDIMASNDGKVVLAEELYLTGNTIIIDHGIGLYSTYAHLDSMNFTKGDYVTKGDIIAAMGTTGFSTGSHLHFSFTYDGIVLNPWSLFETNPLDHYIN